MNEQWQRPIPGEPQPVSLSEDARRVAGARNLVGAVVNGDPRLAIEPGDGILVIQFVTSDGNVIDPLVLVVDAAGEKWVNDLVTKFNEGKTARYYERDAIIYCPGPCGRQLYGDVKARGACLDCFPPADMDAQPNLDPDGVEDAVIVDDDE